MFLSAYAPAASYSLLDIYLEILTGNCVLHKCFSVRLASGAHAGWCTGRAEQAISGVIEGIMNILRSVSRWAVRDGHSC